MKMVRDVQSNSMMWMNAVHANETILTRFVLFIIITVFALVTGSGSLIVYNMLFRQRALVKMTAHAGDATTLDWHPKHRDIIATGGASDRCVKVWDLEDALALDKQQDEKYLSMNQNTWTSKADSIATDSSTEHDSRYVRE